MREGREDSAWTSESVRFPRDHNDMVPYLNNMASHGLVLKEPGADALTEKGQRKQVEEEARDWILSRAFVAVHL